MHDATDASTFPAIKFVGVGGGGNNAISRMVDAGLKGVEFVAVNTDTQALPAADADITLGVGDEFTKGLGAGGNPDGTRPRADPTRWLMA